MPLTLGTPDLVLGAIEKLVKTQICKNESSRGGLGVEL